MEVKFTKKNSTKLSNITATNQNNKSEIIWSNSIEYTHPFVTDVDQQEQNWVKTLNIVECGSKRRKLKYFVWLTEI